MKDAEWTDMNEKLIFWIFRSLVFELWSILHSKIIKKSTNFEYKNDHISKTYNRIKTENWFFICSSTFRIFHVNLNTNEIVKKLCPCIYLFGWKNWWRASPPTLPELRPWTPHFFGLRTLTSLVSVNGLFRKNP